jgi:hypothetical protein
MSVGAVLGAIEIQMLADLARLRQDMDSAKGIVGAAAKTMQGALSVVGAGLSITAFAGWIKSAIDAGDATKEFSQKTGLAARDVAGLQLAFRQGGVGSEELEKSIGKLSRQMVDGNQTFKDLGIQTRNTDGTLRSVKQVLYDTADAFAGMDDGAVKSARAQEIFGKSGAALIPTLNEGAEGLRKMAETAERLGLVIDSDTAEAADKFNDTLDLLHAGSEGMARQMAAQLLPTLNDLAGAMVSTGNSGDALRVAADALGYVLKALFSVGAIGVEVFNTIGKALGGTIGAVIAVIEGRYRDAWEIAKASAADVGEGWANTASRVGAAWSGSSAAVVGQMAAVVKAIQPVVVLTKEQEAAIRKQREEEEKLLKAGQDYIAQINAKHGELMQELSLGRALTEAEKEQIKLEQQLTQGKIKLTEQERASAIAKLQEIDAVREQRRQQDEYAKLLVSVAQHTSKWEEEQDKATESLRAGNVALIEENEKLRIGEQAWIARQQAVMLAQATDLEWQASTQGGNYKLEEQARLLRDRAGLLKDGVVLREAKAASEEWKKTADSINSGLTDALMRAFESGKGFWEAFRSVLVNTAKTLILKPVIEFIISPVGNAISAAMGSLGFAGGASASTGAGASSGGSLMSASTYVNAGKALYNGLGNGVDGLITSSAGQRLGLSQVYENGAGQGVVQATSLGSAVGYGMGAVGGHYLGRAISGGYSIGGGSGNGVVNAGTALGLILGGPLGGIVGGAIGGLTNRAFGHGATQTVGQGIEGVFGGGAFAGAGYANRFREGGLFTSDQRWTERTSLDAEIGSALSASAKAMLDQAKRYGQVLNLPVSQLAAVTANARVELTADATKNAEAIGKALQGYGDALTGTFAGGLAGAGQAAETSMDTLQRLGAGLLSVNGVFDMLGVQLLNTSVAGGKAASDLLDLTGGLDAFLAKTQSYLQNYYSQGEQSGIVARDVLGTLGRAGIDFGAANSRDDLRSLLESLDPNAQSGREQIAALLNVAGDFAKLTDYLGEQNLTLAQLAAMAPQGTGYTAGLATASGVAAGDSSTALLQTANDSLASISQGTDANTVQLQNLVNLQSAANQALLAQLEAMTQALEEQGRLADLAPDRSNWGHG